MENPNTWKPLEECIAQAIADFDNSINIGVCGLSLIRYIADALRREGYIKES